MTGLTTTVKDGQITLPAPADWPDGTEVRIEPIPAPRTMGIREEDWPNTPEGIARHLALMDRTVPPDIGPEERAEWEAARESQKHLEEARFEGHAEALRDGWE